jgi:hypothetical protein
MKTPQKEYLQSAMFGFNDALVSTTGVIVGISTGTGDKQIVILAGIVNDFSRGPFDGFWAVFKFKICAPVK